MIEEVRWVVVLASGERQRGQGEEPGISTLFAGAVGAVLHDARYGPLWVAGGKAGISLVRTREGTLTRGPATVAWSARTRGDWPQRAWLMGDGSGVGIGPTLEAVEAVRTLVTGCPEAHVEAALLLLTSV